MKDRPAAALPDASGDDAAHYGGIGSVIGCEISQDERNKKDRKRFEKQTTAWNLVTQ